MTCTNHRWTAVDYAVLFWYCGSGTLKYRDIWVIIINSFVAPHNTMLYYFLFYFRWSRYVFTWLQQSNSPSPMQNADYLSNN